MPDVDPQILQLVMRLAGSSPTNTQTPTLPSSTMGPPPVQDTPPPPIAQQPYVQAEQLTAQAAPPPDATQGMSPMKTALYKGIQGFGQGLAYSHTPGGYAGHVQLEHQNERQRQQDLLTRAKELRGEGLQQSQLNQRGIEQQQQQDYQNAQLEQVKRLRDIEEQKLNQPEAGMGAMGTYYQKGPKVGQVITPAPEDAGLPKSVEALEMTDWLQKNPGKTPSDWYDYKQSQGGEPLYPVMQGNNIVYTPRSQAAGKSAPRTTFDISGMPTTAGQRGVSLTPPPPVPDITQSNLAGWKLAIDTLDKQVIPNLQNVGPAFGPLAGRIKLAEIERAGGLGATPQQIQMAISLRRLLMSQAFAEGGKQLTPTEKVEFQALNPALTDTLEQAIIKAQQARDYLAARYQARVDVMGPREAGQIPAIQQQQSTPSAVPPPPKDQSFALKPGEVLVEKDGEFFALPEAQVNQAIKQGYKRVQKK